MKTRRNWLILLLLLLVGCVPVKPPVVDPPEPPVLTMQRQKRLMEEFKLTGFMPHSGGYYVLVEEE